MKVYKNVSYVFMPFIYNGTSKFENFVETIDKSNNWEPTHDEIAYMFKYVAEKIDSYDKKNCRCFHYTLTGPMCDKFSIGENASWYETKKHPFKEDECSIKFRILKAHLYCFSTSVGILALTLNFEKDDPIWIANAQYYLKKVSREKIHTKNVQDETTFLEISEKMMAEFETLTDINFFYYSNAGKERANLLTYIEVEEKEDFKEELFYLNRSRSTSFLYDKSANVVAEEMYVPSKDTVWGISSEAAVCLACPKMLSTNFVYEVFYPNFNREYLFMYVLLLHQKYVLYMFLTKIGIGYYNNLDVLEEYRQELYEFETDFVFSCITEVPQYQNLYDKMTQAFSLKKMYEDVHEPLVSLSEIRKVVAENNQKKRDDNVNKALLMLTLLSFFSALIDSFDFVDSFFSWFFGEWVIKIIQSCTVLGIFVIIILVLKSLITSGKE